MSREHRININLTVNSKTVSLLAILILSAVAYAGPQIGDTITTLWYKGDGSNLTAVDGIDIRTFGAVGNDEIDDTAAIQAALNSVNNTNVGTRKKIFIPCGRFIITSTLIMPLYYARSGDNVSAIQLQGESKYCSIIENHAPANTPTLMINNNSEAWEISNIYFAGNFSYPNEALNLTRSRDGKIHDNIFYPWGNAIVSKQGNMIDVYQNDFWWGGEAYLSKQGASNPLPSVLYGIVSDQSQANPTDFNYVFKVNDNRFAGNTTSAIYSRQTDATPGNHGYMDNWEIRHNTIEPVNATNGGGAINVTGLRYSTIEGNWFETVYDTNGGTQGTAINLTDSFVNMFRNNIMSVNNVNLSSSSNNTFEYNQLNYFNTIGTSKDNVIKAGAVITAVTTPEGYNTTIDNAFVAGVLTNKRHGRQYVYTAGTTVNIGVDVISPASTGLDSRIMAGSRNYGGSVGAANYIDSVNEANSGARNLYLNPSGGNIVTSKTGAGTVVTCFDANGFLVRGVSATSCT